MSSEDSSNRVDSGNAFKGDSLYQSSPGGRQTPDFSWTEFSQKDSASRWHEAAEGSFRLEGEQGNDEASSSDQIEWSCAYSISTFTLRDALRLLDQYGMQVSIPQVVEKAHRPPKGHVMASEIFLKFRVCFPLHQCFRDVLNFYELTVFQVMPNRWAHMIELFVLFHRAEDGPLFSRGVFLVLYPKVQ